MTNKRRDIGPRIYGELEVSAARVGITLSQLAVKLGVSRSVPNRWKNGTTPTMELYSAFKEELEQMAMDQLLCAVDDGAEGELEEQLSGLSF